MTFARDALAGQHIVISGGRGALGLEIVARLESHGARVSVNDMVDLPAGGGFYFRGDLAEPGAAERFIEAAEAANGPVHTALCHAGIVVPDSLLDAKPDEWDRTFAVNVKAAFLLGQAAARAMVRNRVQGQLVFTASWVAAVPWPGIGAYNASKAAMNQLMRSFARELAPNGIRANAVAPGIVGTGMARKQWDEDPVYRARAQRAIPLGRLQTPGEVADAFVFLCSPAARYMTGSILLVDGGCSLYPMDPGEAGT